MIGKYYIKLKYLIQTSKLQASQKQYIFIRLKNLINPMQLNSIYILSLICIIGVLVTKSNSQTCSAPQKGIYMSYNALSKRDTMPNLFREVTKTLNTYNDSFTNSTTKKTYQVQNFQSILFYNQHHQKQSPINPEQVNVSLGDLYYGFSMQFRISSISNLGQTKIVGRAIGGVLMEQTAYFTKKLILENNFLQWEPIEISTLHILNPLYINQSQITPSTLQQKAQQLSEDDKFNIQSLINGHEGTHNILMTAILQINQKYKEGLKKHLHSEQLISTSNITYQNSGKNYSFLHKPKNYTLANNQTKGLEVLFWFQLQNQTKQCASDVIQFNQKEFGGLQQIYSLTSMQETFKFALKQGLYSVKLDRKWEVPVFQFYMGDLANFIPAAATYLADSAFYGDCEWNLNGSKPSFGAFSQNQVFAQAPITCNFLHNSNKFLTINFTLFLVITVIPLDDTLEFIVNSGDFVYLKYQSTDPTFKVENQDLMRYYIKQVIKGLKGKRVFGTGWKTINRRFPSLFINSNHLIVFDPSEL